MHKSCLFIFFVLTLLSLDHPICAQEYKGLNRKELRNLLMQQQRTLDSTKTVLKNTLMSTEKEINQLHDEIEEKNSDLSNQKSQFEKNKSTLNAEIAALNETKQTLETKLKLLNQAVEEQKETHEKELKALNNQLITLQDSVDYWKSEVDYLIAKSLHSNYKIDSINNVHNFNIEDFDFFENSDRYILKPNNNGKSNKDNFERYNGSFTSYYGKGYDGYGENLKYADGKIVNGLKDGVWTYYFCDGTKKLEGQYKNGKKIGKWINHDFCNTAEIFSATKEREGFLGNIALLINYCFPFETTRELWANKEVCYFHNDKQSDTIYYLDDENLIQLKLSCSDKILYYSNNQKVINMELEEALDFIDLNKTGSLEFYFPNGKVMYSLSSQNHTFTERRYYKTGERSQGVYQNDSGKFISYDRNGKVVEEYIDRYPFHSGKFVEECNCQ